METTTGGTSAAGSTDLKRRIKDSANAAVQRTKSVASEELQRGAGQVAQGAQSAASAMRKVADEIGSENSWLGGGLRSAASTLENSTQSLMGGDLDRLGRELNQFAHRQPAIFLGASLAIGFALARVAKTALERDAMNDDGLYDEPMQAM
jgi:hypothetical protein